MQCRGVAQPYAFQIFTAHEFQGVECALWPSLYHSTVLCESLIAGQSNRKSRKASFLHKVLSPVVDFSLDYELLQYLYDRWLFKTITGAINSSRASEVFFRHLLAVATPLPAGCRQTVRISLVFPDHQSV